MLRKTVLVASIVVLGACAGCQTHAQNKKAAQERWQKASSRIKLALAQQQYDNGKYEEAEQNIRECIQADPEVAQAHLVLGKVLLAKGRTDKAAEELKLAVDLDQQLHEAWYWLGVAAEQSRDIEQAYSCYNRAMTLEPANLDYILAVAEVYTARKTYDQATALLEEKMKIMPRQISLKVAAADVMCRAERYDDAIELYRQAMLLAEEDPDIAESLGYCYMFAGRWDQAAQVFSKLAARLEEPAPAAADEQITAAQEQRRRLYLQTAGLCSMQSGRYDQAVDCYSKLMVDGRDDARFWVKTGNAALGAGLTDRSLLCGQKAHTLRPGYVDAIALIGASQYAQGNYTSAAKTFKKITNGRKNPAFAWWMLARCYERLGQTEQAEAAYEKAREIDPDSQLGRVLAGERYSTSR